MDLLIRNGTVVTMNRDREVLSKADVWVEGGRIVHVGLSTKTRRGQKPAKTLDATDKVVLPGFIHAHLHACQTLFRGSADGFELLDWLRERIWPLEAAHDEQSMRASADLAFAELIKSGATACLDMGTVRHTDMVFESARACGFRLTSGKAMMDHGQGLPAGLRESTRASLDESERLCKSWHGREDGRLRYAFAPRFVLSCSPELLTATAGLAKQLQVRVHSHASENAQECDLVRQRFGRDNVDLFHEFGMSGPQVTLAHCIWLTAHEQRLMRETGTVMCHCPSSNLKLASGIAKVPELLSEGVRMSLGADSTACNNTLDMFMEMRLAALIHAPRAGPRALSPLSVLEMATLGGARALGLESEIGSLEPGKRADITVVDLSALHATPAPKDVLAHLVYAGRASDVRHVIIDGREVLRNGKLMTMDEKAVRREANHHAERLLAQVA